MASLWKHPKSSFWTACYTDVQGKQRKRSTKCKIRKEAQKVAEEYEAIAKREKNARWVRGTMSELHERYTGEKLRRPTVKEYAEEWLKIKEPEVADSTFTFYKKSLRKFLEHMGKGEDQEISMVNRQQINSFRNYEFGKLGLAPKTVNHDLKTLKMFFRSAKKDGYLLDDPSEFVDTVRATNPKIRTVFTMEQIKSILAVCDDEWRSMVIFGLYTGQRISDISGWTWENFDLLAKEIRFVVRKTSRPHIVPIWENSPLEKHINGLKLADDPKAPIHPRAYGILQRQGKTGNLSNQFADILASAGLREKKAHRSVGKGRSASRNNAQLSFHCLRHTTVSLAKEYGIPEATVMALVGHDSKQMSQHYTHVGKEALGKAIATLPDVL